MDGSQCALLQSHPTEGLVNSILDIAETIEPRKKLEILESGKVPVEVAAMCHEAQFFPPGFGMPQDVDAADFDVT
jgi:hypothetical protein